MCSVRQRRHSSEPRWLRRMYGSYECVYVCIRRVVSLVAPLRSGRGTTNLVQVDDTHSNFTQTLPSVDIGLGCPGDTTATKLRTDSIL